MTSPSQPASLWSALQTCIFALCTLAHHAKHNCEQACSYDDWWWKARLGKAYYQLGLLRDAEQQLASSLRQQVRRFRMHSKTLQWVEAAGAAAGRGAAAGKQQVSRHG